METFRKTLLSIIAIVILAGLGFGFIEIAKTMQKEPERSETPPVPLAVDTIPLKRTDFTEQIRAFGVAQPLRAAELRSQVSGEIVSLPRQYRVGAFVKEGDVLAEIDDTQYVAEVKRRESLLEQARTEKIRVESELKRNQEKLELIRSDRDLAEKDLERQKDLFGQNAVSEAAVDNARERLQAVQQRLADELSRLEVLEASLRSAETSIEARQAELAQAHDNLEHTKVTAPFDGRLDQKLAETGDFAQPGQQLFRLVSTEALELPLEVPASQGAALREGAPATVVTSEEPPRRTTGRVERISPTVDERNRTVSAFVVIENQSEVPFPPGTFLSAEVEGRTFNDVVAIPRSAIIDGAIFLADDGVAVEMKPDFFAFVGKMALTRDEMPVNEGLITTGFERLYDGAPIIPSEDSPSEAGLEETSTQVSDVPGLS